MGKKKETFWQIYWNNPAPAFIGCISAYIYGMLGVFFLFKHSEFFYVLGCICSVFMVGLIMPFVVFGIIAFFRGIYKMAECGCK